MKLWKKIKKQMLRNPNQIICENNIKITYEEMLKSAEKFALKLRGLKSCAVLCNSELFASKAILSCLAANVTVIPLSVRYGKIHCKKILDYISPNAIITDMDFMADGLNKNESMSFLNIKTNKAKSKEINKTEEFKTYKICTETKTKKEADNIKIPLTLITFKNFKYKTPKEKPAAIMCTSGTTGTPKGVMLSQKNILTNVLDICSYFDIKNNDYILISRPLYHSAVLTGEFLTSVFKGAKIRFFSEKFNPIKIASVIKKQKITTFCSTPTIIPILIRIFKNNKNIPLKNIVISGECMDKKTGFKIAEFFENADVYYVYGLTEASPRVSYLNPKFFKKYPDCVGKTLKSVKFKITKNKETGKGILYLKGNSIMKGYYNNKPKTKEVLKNGWLCTGDIAELNENGFLKIKGRNDDMIIKAGMNIYPQEIEQALKEDERVKEVVAYGYKNKDTNQTNVGIKISGDFKSEEEVKELCLKVLPEYELPQKINILKRLKKNGSGKMIRS